LVGCDAYSNTASGIRASAGTSGTLIQNCNVVANGTYGIDAGATADLYIRVENCGYGSGTMANASGDSNASSVATNFDEVGKVTYAANVTPWVDPDNGDFRINLAAAKGTGRGTYQQTGAGYAGAVGYPDIGAAQHQETGGSAVVGVIGS
jgi:hypothetical protein